MGNKNSAKENEALEQFHQSLNINSISFNYNPHRFALQFQLIKATNTTSGGAISMELSTASQYAICYLLLTEMFHPNIIKPLNQDNIQIATVKCH